MESLFGAVTRYVLTAARETLGQILLLLGPALILGLCMHGVSRAIQRKAIRLFGMRTYLLLFGWLGTAVHELGHALFCPLFGHRIVQMRLFQPDPASGALGYVRHTFNPRNAYHVVGNFFISVGPVVLGSLLVYLAGVFLIGPELLLPFAGIGIGAEVFASVGSALESVGRLAGASVEMVAYLFSFERLTDWKLYLFLYLVFSIGSSISLSPSDLRGAARGGRLILGLWLVFNLATNWIFGTQSALFAHLGTSSGAVYSVLMIALILNAIAAAVLLLIPMSGKLVAGHARNLRSRL